MKLYVRLMALGFLLGAFAGGYSQLTRIDAGADAAGYAVTTAFVFGMVGTACGAAGAFFVRLLLSFRDL